VSQYDKDDVESAGLVKFDFLGLATLTILEIARELIMQRHQGQENFAFENIPLNDAATYKLFSDGKTEAVFQFESRGMQGMLRDARPSRLEDLIALNALYRPGPMDLIPSFVARKHGREEVAYPHPLVEAVLSETYGIMVYQEQVMQTAQILGGYSLGGADLLRRAMGKKDAKTMEAQKEVFVKGAGEKGIDAGKAEEVFEVMQKFAEYGFNRSHSAAYSILAYQTGFLKANYPAEYMAAVLTRNMGEIKKITFFMDECRKQGIAVLGPDVNESEYTFTVNTRGQIRFGLGAVKGVGEGAVAAIIDERKANGPYTSIFNLTSRINLRAANKRCLESLAFSGAFDAFDGVHRAQYFHREENENENLLERAVRYGAALQDAQNATQINLFGEVEESIIPEPIIPTCAKWNKLQQLKFEKEVIGFYLSGHPLDLYKLEMTAFCRQRISDVKDRELLAKYQGREVIFAGLVAAVAHKTGQNGSGYGSLTLEDYEDTITLNLFSESYLKFRHLLIPEAFLFVRARVEPRYKQPDQLELRVSHVQLLADVREKFTSGLQLSLSLEELDEVQVNRLVEVLQRHPGKCPVKVSVVERKSGLKVDMRSRRHQVSVSGELMEALRTLDQVRVDLLTGSMA
jgi:DNA polymerase-3 subunit alpha